MPSELGYAVQLPSEISRGPWGFRSRRLIFLPTVLYTSGNGDADLTLSAKMVLIEITIRPYKPPAVLGRLLLHYMPTVSTGPYQNGTSHVIPKFITA